MAVEELIELIGGRDAGQAAGGAGFERGGGASCAKRVGQRSPMCEGGGVSAVEDIAATGGIDGGNLKGGEMHRPAIILVAGVPATILARSHHNGRAIRVPQSLYGSGGIGLACNMGGEIAGEDQVIHQGEQ